MKNLYIQKNDSSYCSDELKKKGDYVYRRLQGFKLSKENIFYWKQKIERWQMMYVLCKLREVLINERNRSYYRNKVNVKEVVDLEVGIYINDCGIKYITHQKMEIYQNDVFDIVMEVVEKKKERGLVK